MIPQLRGWRAGLQTSSHCLKAKHSLRFTVKKSKTKTMSTKSNRSSSSAAAAKPQKKAKRSPDEYWKTLLPYLEMASEKQVQDLAKDLFEELWKTSGEKSAKAVAAPFWKKLKEDKDMNLKAAGTWVPRRRDGER